MCPQVVCHLDTLFYRWSGIVCVLRPHCPQLLCAGYPGLDLIIFPEYSTQGFHPTKWNDFTTTLDGPEVAIFKQVGKQAHDLPLFASRLWCPVHTSIECNATAPSVPLPAYMTFAPDQLAPTALGPGVHSAGVH